MRALALAIGLALCAAAGTAGAQEVKQLLERAEFWQVRQRDDLAREELEKVLRLAPDHPEALATLGRLQLRANQEREANATLERLRKAHPSHAATAQLSALLRSQGADKDRLRQARQLARAGRTEEALKAFRSIFPDTFPDDDFALEHAQLVAATPGGWERGRALMADLVKKHPDDPKFRVALVSHVSTRKPVGAETLKALGELAAIPSVSRQAREAWRRAVIAMDATEESLPALREYIAANPGETAVGERLEQVLQAIAQGRRVPPDPATRARREGWAALDAGRIDEAEARLAEALKQNANDAEAIAGLGLVRMRQGRHAEALERFEHAARLDASSRAKWENLARTARFWDLLQQARGAREAGRLDEARARAAEARALDTKEPAAAMELARIHVSAGRDSEAEALLGELDAAQRGQVTEAINELRAGRQRDKARELQAQARFAEAIAALEEGAALDPMNPWVRHDLARLYAARGEAARGRALFDELLRRRPNDADPRYAFALFLSSIEREAEAMAVLEAVAPVGRSANMARLQRRLWISVQGQRALALAKLGERVEAQRIVARAREVAGDDRELALEVARALDRMEADRELREVLDHLARLGPSASEDPAAVAALERSMALRQARALRDSGRGAEAAEIYRGVLRASPDDRDAGLALVETLLERGDFEAARPLVEAALQASPDDPRALTAAGRLAARQGRIDDAIAYERRALARESRNESWRYRRLAEWLDDQASWYSSALDWLHRSGTRGKSQVSAQELPLAWKQGWTRAGRWFVRVAPARVASGALDMAETFEVNTFGTLLLCQPLCGEDPPAQSEKGVALGAGFERGPWKADFGTTPIGFPVVNLLGGLAYAGELGTVSYSVEASRRPVTASLLSYAGTRDPNSGRTWGGVVANGVRVKLSRDLGGDYGAWGQAGLYRLTGRNVQDNDKGELMAGAYRRLVNEEDQVAMVGVTGMLWRFSENAGEYTFGHGGYYSPRSYRSISLPVTYTYRTLRTSFSLRAAVSAAWSESRRAPFYPTDAGLQAQAEALAPASFVEPFHAGGNNGRSIGRSLAAAAERQLAPGVFLGARMEVERSTNYTPNRFLLYVRLAADGVAARPVSLPPEPGLPGFQY